MEKSYVSIEKNVCSICDAVFDTGTILFDRRLRSSMEICTVTGLGLCPEHMKLFNEGFIALVECDPQRSNIPVNASHINPDQVYRTGCIAHLRREAFAQIFNVPVDDKQPIVFVEKGVIEQLQSMVS